MEGHFRQLSKGADTTESSLRIGIPALEDTIGCPLLQPFGHLLGRHYTQVWASLGVAREANSLFSVRLRTAW